MFWSSALTNTRKEKRLTHFYTLLTTTCLLHLWLHYTPDLRRLKFRHPAFATFLTVRPPTTTTTKTRIYHRLTTANDAEFIGNTERTRRLAASQLRVGGCLQKKKPLCIGLQFLSIFFTLCNTLTFQCVWVKEISCIECKTNQNVKKNHSFGNEEWSFEFTWGRIKVGGLASRFKLSHSTLSKILEH
jgi:hypothetical protein